MKIFNYVSETIKSKSYWVDTLSASSFYFPLCTFNERVISEMSCGETLKRRAIGMGIGLMTTRPMCKIRDAWKKYVWKVDEKNPGKRGIIADLTLTLGVVPTIYIGTLALGSIGENKTFLENLETGWQGTALIFAGLPFFVKYLDYNRKKFGTLPLQKDLERKGIEEKVR